MEVNHSGSSTAEDLRAVSNGLYISNTYIGRVKKGLSFVKKNLSPIEKAKIEAEILTKALVKVDKLNQTLTKVSLTKPLAKTLDPVIEGLLNTISDLNEEIQKAANSGEKITTFIDKLETNVSRLDKLTLALAVATDIAAVSVAETGQNLQRLNELDKSGLEAGFKQRLIQSVVEGDSVLDTINSEIQPFKTKLEETRTKLSGFDADFLENGLIELVEKLADVVSKAKDAIGQVVDPIADVVDLIEPILDALSFIFFIPLGPLEDLLEKGIEATGIKALISELEDEIKEQLPNFDGFIGLSERLEKLFLDDLKKFEEDVEDSILSLLADLKALDRVEGDEGDNVLTGSVSGGAEFSDGFTPPSEGFYQILDGKGGNDALFGSRYADVMKGGSGADIFFASSGNDRIIGGTNIDDIALGLNVYDAAGNLVTQGQLNSDETYYDSTGEVLYDTKSIVPLMDVFDADRNPIAIGDIDPNEVYYDSDGAARTEIRHLFDYDGQNFNLLDDDGNVIGQELINNDTIEVDGKVMFEGTSVADVVVYEGSMDDYSIVSVIGENGFATGRWLVSDRRLDAELGGTSEQTSSGTDELFGIELLYFTGDDGSYETLDLTLGTFIRSTSVDGGPRVNVTLGTTDIFVEDTDGTLIPVYTSNGIDRWYGAAGYDRVFSGPGNDLLFSGSNGPLTRTYAEGDLLLGGVGNDTYIVGPYSADVDQIQDVDQRIDGVFIPSGNDTVNYLQSVRGVNVFLGKENFEEQTQAFIDDWDTFYRPTSIFIDADYEGRSVNPDANVSVKVGQIRGVENIQGSNFDDVLIGYYADNVIDAAAGDDQIRGLRGDDILRGGDGADILVGDAGDDLLEGGDGADTYVGGLGNDHIVDRAGGNSTVKYSAFAEEALYDESVKFVDFFTTGFGTYNQYDMPDRVEIFGTAVRGEQEVIKYVMSGDTEIEVGIDFLEGIDRIVGSIGDDLIISSPDINQTIFGNDGDDLLSSDFGITVNTFYGGPGDDLFNSNALAADTFYGGAGSEIIIISDDPVLGSSGVEGDSFFGDDNLGTPLEGTDQIVFDSSFSWHVYMDPDGGDGQLVGKQPLSIEDAADLRYIQPTAGVNGEDTSSVLVALLMPDLDTADPGGRASGFGEFEIVLGSEQRDIIVGGNPDFGVTYFGEGGDDVLYAAQMFASELFGGDGNDVLGTYNHSYGKQQVINFFDDNQITVLDGGDGDDIIVPGDFRERIDGGAGVDLLTYEVSTAGVRVDLTGLTLDGGYAKGDELVGGIENVDGSQHDDVIIGDGDANTLVGWHGDDIILGQAGADLIFGNDGDDFLYGGAGADLIHGGNGADLIDGGDGTDTASWTFYQDSSKGGAERLTNDTNGITADLETGGAGEDTLASIENLVGGVGDDVFFGDDKDNFLAGHEGDDQLDGRGGDDVLIGGQGNDSLLGGAGEDYLNGGAGINTIDGGEGIDTLDFSSKEYGIELTMAGVGSRTGLDTGEATFFASVDFYVWSDSLTETVGPTGDPEDMIPFGTDEVRFTVEVFDQGTEDPIDDVIQQREAVTPERIWQLDPTFADELSDLDPVLFLPDTLSPEYQVSAIEAYEEATDFFKDIERIFGSEGDDQILGNDENTFFYGGLGADTIDGGGGVDTASFDKSEAGVTVDLQNLTFMGGEAEGDILMGFEVLIGSEFDDNLAGDGSDNEIHLLGGSNFARGHGGVDTVVLDYRFTDVSEFQGFADGVNIMRFDGAMPISVDFIANDIEVLSFKDRDITFADLLLMTNDGTEGADVLIGTPISDSLDGRGGNDIVQGLDSGDILLGSDGNDLLEGEGGDDRLDGGMGRDRYVGGAGDDTYIVDDSTEIVIEIDGEGDDTVESSVDFTLPDHVETLTLTGNLLTTGVGNDLDNMIVGNDGANVLVGRGGADRLDGGLGPDTLVGGAGNDRYIINEIIDVVVGEAADGGFDQLFTTVDYTVPENVEIIAVAGGASVHLTGNDGDNEFGTGIGYLTGSSDPLDRTGSSTFDGAGGSDTLIVGHDFEGSTFHFDAEGFLTITNGDVINRVKSIEKLDFTDQFFLWDDLLDAAFPNHAFGQNGEGVRIVAVNPDAISLPIDMSDLSGGAQFVHTGEFGPTADPNTQYYFSTANGVGTGGFYVGTGFGDPESGHVSFIQIQNGQPVSGDAFDIIFPGDVPGPHGLQNLTTANWAYFTNVVFADNDTIVATRLGDSLHGFKGDDVLFGEAGNDVLRGDEGDDTLIGGDGADAFVLHADLGVDLVRDFEIGIDFVDVSSLTHDEQALITLVQFGGDTEIRLSDGGVMVLEDVLISELPLDPSAQPNLDPVELDIALPDESFPFAVSSIADAGDVNNDGIDDFVIGWTDRSFFATISPIAYIVYGKAGEDFDLSIQPFMLGLDEGFSIQSETGSSNISVAAAGDFNDDGIDDVMVGTQEATYVVFGRDGDFDNNVELNDLTASEGVKLDVAGTSSSQEFVAGGFDLNGDGIDDVVVSDAQSYGATLHVVFGSGVDDPLPATIDGDSLNGANGLRLIGPSTYSGVGVSVASAGDVNGDGFDDLIIGTRFLSVESPDGSSYELVGGAYVVFGSDQAFASTIALDELSGDQGFVIEGDFATGQDRTGASVQGGGDVNGDGFDDVVLTVGRATLKADGGREAVPGDLIERAYVVFGSSDPLGESFDLVGGGTGLRLKLADLDGTNGTLFTKTIPEGYREDPVGNANQGNFSSSIGTASVEIVDDLNNDRIADLVVSTSDFTRSVIYDPVSGESESVFTPVGETQIIYGSAGGFGAIYELQSMSLSDGVFLPDLDNSAAVLAVRYAGDVNNDGGADLLLGSSYAPSKLILGTPFSNFPVTGAVEISGLGEEDQILTANLENLLDPDGFASMDYQWFRDFAPILGATEATYLLTQTDVGSDIHVEVMFEDSFGEAGTSQSAVFGPIANVNDAPEAESDSFVVYEDTPLRMNLLANDFDADGDTLSFEFALSTLGPAGSLQVNADQTVTFTPNDQFTGDGLFQYSLTDSLGASSGLVRVDLDVVEVNDAPLVPDTALTITEDVPFEYAALVNVTDEEGDSFSIVGASDGDKSTVTFTDDTLTITGNANAVGSDEISFTVRDERGAETTAMIDITLLNVNDAPTPMDDYSRGPERLAQVIDVLANDTDPDEGDVLTVTSVTGQTNTTTEINPDGTITVTPIAESFGTETLTYFIRDEAGAPSLATVTVIFDEINDPPVAFDDVALTNEDAAVEIDVQVNDEDYGENDISVQSVTNGGFGTVEILGTGNLRYTPNPNASGLDEFSYVLTDENGKQSSANVRVTVAPLPDSPIANNDTAQSIEDVPLSLDVLANDVDPDEDAVLEVLSVSGQTFTSTEIGSDGVITITPDANVSGTETLTYAMQDDTGRVSTAQLVITFEPVYDPPLAVADSFTMNEDNVAIFDVLANDEFYLEQDIVLINAVSQPAFGTIVDFFSGQIEYRPNPDFVGQDSFEYTFSNGFGSSSTATVSVDVLGQPDNPAAVDDTAQGSEGNAVTIDVLGNDTDADADAVLRVVAVAGEISTTTNINADGTVTVTPQAFFAGTEILTYTVEDETGLQDQAELSVTFAPFDNAPVAANDSATTDEDVPVQIDVLANDEDFGENDIFIGSFSDGGFGSVTELIDGNLLYTPNADFAGNDSFSYVLEDNAGNQSTATVTVDVSAQPDAPRPVDDVTNGTEGIAVTVDVLSNDIDPDNGSTLSVISVSGATFTTPTINADGTITVTPNAQASGTEILTYTVADETALQGTAQLIVSFGEVDDVPIARDDEVSTPEETAIEIDVLANDLDFGENDLTVSGFSDGGLSGTLELQGNIFIYTPEQDFNGDESFSYVISDESGNESSALVTIDVTPVQDDPIAVDKSIFVSQDTAFTFDPLVSNTGNPDDADSDPDGDAIFLDDVQSASNGTVELVDGGIRILYTPNAGFSGDDSFTYRINDSTGRLDQAEISVTVGRNDVPVANPDTYNLTEDTALIIDLSGSDNPLSNDDDRENDVFSMSSVGAAANGALVLDTALNTLTYTPGANLNGEALDVVNYTVTDEFGRTATSTLTFNVTPVDDPITGVLEIIETSTRFGPEFEVSYDSLRDVDGGIPGLSIDATGEYVFTDDPFSDWVWRTEAGAVVSGGPYLGQSEATSNVRVTVEGLLTDADGNTQLVRSALSSVIPEYVLILEEPGGPGIDEFDAFNDNFDPDNGLPTFARIRDFELGVDTIDLSRVDRETAINAVNDAISGSAILTFPDGSVLSIEGEGVSPETIDFGNFIFQPGNIDPTGDVQVSGTLEEGAIVTVDASGVADLEGIDFSSVAYQWQRDGVDIPGATASNYQIDPSDVGSTLNVIYTFEDAFGTQESVTSADFGPVTAGGAFIWGTFEEDTLNGTAGSDTFFGQEADDVINPGRGNDLISGGPGLDRVTFTGHQNNYTIEIVDDYTSIITDRRVGGDGRDNIGSIELLDFATELPLFGGQPMRFDFFDGPAQLSEEEFAPIIELYIAYFNRAPDALGLYFWATAYTNGTSLEEMASLFVGQPETQIEYPQGTSNTVFAETVYNNVLGRTPDIGGFNFWVGLLDDGFVARDAFILEVLRGAKAEPTPGQTQEFIDQQIADRAYLETKTDIGAYFSVLKGMSEVNSAKSVMSLFDGTAESVTATVNAIDDVYEDALDPIDGQFLMPLLYGYDDPFSP